MSGKNDSSKQEIQSRPCGESIMKAKHTLRSHVRVFHSRFGSSIKSVPGKRKTGKQRNVHLLLGAEVSLRVLETN